MKNKFLGLSFFLFFFSMFLVSCDTEPLDSDLANEDDPIANVLFAANFGGENYSTNNASASVENGVLTILATKPSGVFLLRSLGAVVGTYTNNQLEFTYTETETGNVYSSIHPVNETSNSQLTVTSIDFQNMSITGTFTFIGYRMTDSSDDDDDDDMPSVPVVEEMIFTHGTFLNIPYGNGITEPLPEPEPEPTTGDYFPMAVGNTWNYTSDATLLLGASQNINGKTYFKETNSFFTGAAEWPDLEEFVAKQNGNYYVAVKSVPGAEHPIATQEIIILKDNIDVGGTWSNSMVLTHTDEDGGVTVITIDTDYIIEEKGIFINIGGITYEDVIKVKSTGTSEMTYNGETFGDEPEVSTDEMWFAKDIGIIKFRSVMTDEPDEVYDLIDYELN